MHLEGGGGSSSSSSDGDVMTGRTTPFTISTTPARGEYSSGSTGVGGGSSSTTDKSSLTVCCDGLIIDNNGILDEEGNITTTTTTSGGGGGSSSSSSSILLGSQGLVSHVHLCDVGKQGISLLKSHHPICYADTTEKFYQTIMKEVS